MTARGDLENELGGPLAAVDLLTDQERADLSMLFREARRQETEGLIRSVDAMIGALPRPLRAPTKKIMFGNLLD
ncbi:hypothetical protein [Nocardia spumae]|uniref:hypothetical protein n=1 Tax=Nocardia spumae TaxID=2887190 RepID=UPI001D14D380|nr:hypothetical protein [Nocardia spumae]